MSELALAAHYCRRGRRPIFVLLLLRYLTRGEGGNHGVLGEPERPPEADEAVVAVVAVVTVAAAIAAVVAAFATRDDVVGHSNGRAAEARHITNDLLLSYSAQLRCIRETAVINSVFIFAGE